MRKIRVPVAAIAAMLASGFGPAGAQESTRWAIETSPVFPVAVQIYMAQAAFMVGERDELLVGPCFQNWKDQGEARGQAHAYTIIFGYRHYFWKGLHAEVELFPAYNRFDSSVDGKTYNGFEAWIEYRIGWKIPFRLGGVDLFITPQPGLAHALYLQNLWPGLSEASYRRNSLMFVPQILLGVDL